MNLADLKIVEEHLRQEITISESYESSKHFPNFNYNEDTGKKLKEYVIKCQQKLKILRQEIRYLIENKLSSLK